MIVFDLAKTSPETIVERLINMCHAAADSGEIVNEPVYVEFKKKVWTVTYVNKFGEFAQMFNSKELATEFATNLLDNNISTDVKIRGTER